MVDIKEFDFLNEIAQRILEEAKKQGAEHAQVFVTSSENIATRFGEGHITQNTQRNTLDFILRSQIGEQVGNYNGTAASPNRLPEMISDAITLVKYSPPDPEFPGFLDTQPVYKKIPRKFKEYGPEDISENIKIMVDDASSFNSKISAVAGSINFTANRLVLANTYGLVAESENTSLSGIVNVAARESENESRSSDTIAGVTMKDLEVDSIASRVAERALNGLNQGELEVGVYPSIFGHGALMELMFHFALASSSASLISHQSPFKDKLGEQLFDKRFSISDSTEDPTHFGSQEFDFDGVPSPTINWLDEGIVKDFAYNMRYAKKLGVEGNGRSVGFPLFRAPSVKAGQKSEQELISSIDNGVYVTNLWYTNYVNQPEGSLTGLTKDGLFKIENGEIVGSVKNMRFSDTLFSMFGNAEPSSDVKMKIHSTYGNLYGLGAKLPSIKLDKFNFSSKGKH